MPPLTQEQLAPVCPVCGSRCCYHCHTCHADLSAEDHKTSCPHHTPPKKESKLTTSFKSLLAQLSLIRSRAAARRAMERAMPTPYGTFHVLPKDFEAIERDQHLQLEQLRLELAEEKRLSSPSAGHD